MGERAEGRGQRAEEERRAGWKGGRAGRAGGRDKASESVALRQWAVEVPFVVLVC